MRSPLPKLPAIAPIILMIAGCDNEGRQMVAEQKPTSETDPFAQDSAVPSGVRISTKFVEITQGTEELSFDWIVAPFGSKTNSPEISE